MQREFYVQRGLKAWAEDRIPNFITSNPFFAEACAGIVFGFLEDCFQQASSARPGLRILELGSGTGKFAYLFLRQMAELLETNGMPTDAVRYCMTDCSPSSIDSWRANSYLQEWVAAGTLCFEELEVGKEIKSEFLNPEGPLVVIANYVFDSLPQDAFVICDGAISEIVVTTGAPESGGARPLLSQVQLSYKNVGVAKERYSEESWNQILEAYRTRLRAATVMFPYQTIKLLEELGRQSDGQMLVLAADKGYAHEGSLQLCQGTPSLEFHGPDCFSQMVNFDAIAKYFRARGGNALLPDKHYSNFNLCGFARGRREYVFPRTSAAYRETQGAFGPDDLFTLMAWLNAHMEEMSVGQILATLRLTRWDPIAFMRLFPILGRQAGTVVAERDDLREAVLRVRENHYPVMASENELAFQCGVVLLELRFFEDALKMFQASQRILGTTAATSYNLGLCFLGLDRPGEALESMIETCNLDPTFQPARLARERLERSKAAQQ